MNSFDVPLRQLSSSDRGGEPSRHMWHNGVVSRAVNYPVIYATAMCLPSWNSDRAPVCAAREGKLWGCYARLYVQRIHVVTVTFVCRNIEQRGRSHIRDRQRKKMPEVRAYQRALIACPSAESNALESPEAGEGSRSALKSLSSFSSREREIAVQLIKAGSSHDLRR